VKRAYFDICGINKYLTTYLARHTFATTITLSKGVPIESVSSMLGHKDIRTTQIYTRVVQQKVSQDMKELRKRMMNNPIMKEESKLKIA
jgi:site-specific recombinase XerD